MNPTRSSSLRTRSVRWAVLAAPLALAAWIAVAATADETPCPRTPFRKEQLEGRVHEGEMRQSLSRWERDLRALRPQVEAAREKAARNGPSAPVAARRERLRVQEGIAPGAMVTSIDAIVADRALATSLGKALFWDMRVGSDGQTACATCHFHAGADNRKPRDPCPGSGDPTAESEGRASMGVASRLFRGVPAGASLLAGVDLGVPFEVGGGYDGMRHRFPRMAVELSELEAQDEAPAKKLQLALSRVRELGDVLAHVFGLTAGGLRFPQSDRLRRVVEVEEVEGIAARARAALETSNIDEDKRKSIVDALNTLTAPRRPGPFFRAEHTDKVAKVRMRSERAARNFVSSNHVPEPDERQFTGRNAPTTHGALWADRLFHDGRARSVFNGYDHLGDDAFPDGVGKWLVECGQLRRVLVRIPHASLASQATVPLLSPGEMSWYGRQYHHVARKLLDTPVLAKQRRSPGDAVLARIGADETYRSLFGRAFRASWVATDRIPAGSAEHDWVDGAPLDLPVIEANFSLLWGIAVMLYEETLVPDDAPFDRYVRAVHAGEPYPEVCGWGEPERRGFAIFLNAGCADCHRGPEFAGATQSTVYGPLTEFEGPDDVFAGRAPSRFQEWLTNGRPPLDERVESMWVFPRTSPCEAVGELPKQHAIRRPYDTGFYNIGVADEDTDPGIDRTGEPSAADNGPVLRHANDQNMFGAGVLESLIRYYASPRTGEPVPMTLSLSLARRLHGEDAFVRGAMRTPTLRNVALTGPYFHVAPVPPTDHPSCEPSIGFVELEQAIELYERPRFCGNKTLHPALPIRLVDDEVRLMAAFLRALTDPRVERDAGPFCHPSIEVPVRPTVRPDGTTAATDLMTIGATEQ